MEVWFGIANGQILSIFDSVICQPHNSACHTVVAGYIILHFWMGFTKNPSFKIMSGWAGIWRRASSQVYLLVNPFSQLYVTFILSGLLSYLVGMKRMTSRRVICKRDNSHFLPYVFISRCKRFIFWITFLKNPSIMPFGIFLVY